MGNDNNQPTNAMERITLKRQLVTRLAEIESRLSGPRLSNVVTLHTEIAIARNHLNSLATEKSVTQRDAAQARYDELVKQMRDGKQERDNLLKERDQLQQELERFDHGITLLELEEQAAKLRAAEAAVSSLSSAIDHQRTIIQASEFSSPDDLHRQKEDLLADAATGKNVSKKLEAVETKIKEFEQNRSQLAKQASDAEQAISGLERRRAEAEKVVRAEKADLDEMLVFWFKSELQTAYRAFIEAGNELTERYRRVAALDALVIETSTGREKSILNIIGSSAYRILGISKDTGDYIFEARTENRPQWVALERERQASAGVPL